MQGSEASIGVLWREGGGGSQQESRPQLRAAGFAGLLSLVMDVRLSVAVAP